MELTANPADTVSDAASAPIAAPEEKPPLTFGELLAGMKVIEDLVDLDDNQLDPEKLVGSLSLKDKTEEQKTAVRAKVDSLEFVVREFEAYGARTEARARRLIARAESAYRKAQGLRNYVLFQMQSQAFDTVAGNEMIVKLKTHHTPRAVPTRPATPTDYAAHPTLVRLIPREYRWDGHALLDLWKNNGKPKDGVAVSVEGLDFVRYEFSQKVVFDERDVPNVGDKKGKRK